VKPSVGVYSQGLARELLELGMSVDGLEQREEAYMDVRWATARVTYLDITYLECPCWRPECLPDTSLAAL